MSLIDFIGKVEEREKVWMKKGFFCFAQATHIFCGWSISELLILREQGRVVLNFTSKLRFSQRIKV